MKFRSFALIAFVIGALIAVPAMGSASDDEPIDAQAVSQPSPDNLVGTAATYLGAGTINTAPGETNQVINALVVQDLGADGIDSVMTGVTISKESGSAPNKCFTNWRFVREADSTIPGDGDGRYDPSNDPTLGRTSSRNPNIETGITFGSTGSGGRPLAIIPNGTAQIFFMVADIASDCNQEGTLITQIDAVNFDELSNFGTPQGRTSTPQFGSAFTPPAAGFVGFPPQVTGSLSTPTPGFVNALPIPGTLQVSIGGAVTGQNGSIQEEITREAEQVSSYPDSVAGGKSNVNYAAHIYCDGSTAAIPVQPNQGANTALPGCIPLGAGVEDGNPTAINQFEISRTAGNVDKVDVTLYLDRNGNWQADPGEEIVSDFPCDFSPNPTTGLSQTCTIGQQDTLAINSGPTGSLVGVAPTGAGLLSSLVSACPVGNTITPGACGVMTIMELDFPKTPKAAGLDSGTSQGKIQLELDPLVSDSPRLGVFPSSGFRTKAGPGPTVTVNYQTQQQPSGFDPANYDNNPQNNLIDQNELQAAVSDWQNDVITKQQLIEVANLWLNDTDLTTLGVSGLSLNTVNLSSDATGTTFAVSGQSIERTHVEVFGLDGSTVFSGETAGNTLSWNHTAGNGDTVANGVYLYRVTVEGANGETVTSQVKKLVVVR